jgi:hypothetical protein
MAVGSRPSETHMIRTAAILAMLQVAQLGLAEAATQPPRFDIKATCRQAQPLGSDDKNVYQGCVQAELDAQRQLAKQWRSFKPDSQRTCTADAVSDGTPSYVELLTCLQFTKDAAALPQQ